MLPLFLSQYNHIMTSRTLICLGIKFNNNNLKKTTGHTSLQSPIVLIRPTASFFSSQVGYFGQGRDVSTKNRNIMQNWRWML